MKLRATLQRWLGITSTPSIDQILMWQSDHITELQGRISEVENQLAGMQSAAFTKTKPNG